MTTPTNIDTAKASLLMNSPFFATLLLRLNFVASKECDTAGVDGKTLTYNEDFVNNITKQQLHGLLVHEVLHCAFGHIFRRKHRDPKLWNVACDYAINPIVLSAGLQLPPTPLVNPKFDGMTAEAIYDKLLQEKTPEEQAQLAEAAQQATGGFSDADKHDVESGEDAWNIILNQAAQIAESRGSLPDTIKRMLKDLRPSSVNWRAALREFIQAVQRNDYSLSRPNKRFLQSGIYLPSLYSESVGEIVVAVDTSGSINDTVLAKFGGEIKAICQDVNPEKVTVVYCDAEINKIDEFENGDLPTLSMHGGGGTRFEPVFEYINTLGTPPECLVYLTDLMGSFPNTEPTYPTIWASINKHTHAPFGTTIYIGD